MTAPAVTKTPVPVPLRTFRTVLLTTRACGRKLELDGEENKKKRWEWDVDVPLGSSVLEISEKGGAVWKVYVDRNFLLDGP